MATSSSSFQLIMCHALDAYKGHTGKDLLAHPLAAQLQTCDSPREILLLLHQQIQALNQSRNTHQRLTRFLDPTVNVLYIFAMVLGEGVNTVCFKTCFLITICRLIISLAGFLARESDLHRNWHTPFSVYPRFLYLRRGHLTSTFQAVRDTRASQGIILEIFERLEFFFQRLEMYTEVPPTPEMKEIIIKIVVEFLSILAMATKDINQCRLSGLFLCKYVAVD
jgi:hypothetical protein